MENESLVCLHANQLLLVPPNTLEYHLQRYVYPILFTLGIVGNALNLLVLVSNEMKHKANFLLAVMASTDIAFLLSMVPMSLASIERLAHTPRFYQLFSMTKNHFVALANWFSATSIWLVLTVTIERLAVIRMPIRSKLHWSQGRITAVILLIFLLSALLTAHHHISYECLIVQYCNGTQTIYKCMSVIGCSYSVYPAAKPVSQFLRYYIQISTVVNAVLVVTVPIIFLCVLNLLLLRHLRKQRRNLRKLSLSAPDEEELKIPSFSTIRQRKQERKVTVTVSTIACCFAIANGPSVFIFLWHLKYNFGVMEGKFYTAASLANLLVVIGKVSNFFLFCTSSRHFRRRLLLYLGRRINHFTFSDAEFQGFSWTNRIMLGTLQIGRRNSPNSNSVQMTTNRSIVRHRRASTPLLLKSTRANTENNQTQVLITPYRNRANTNEFIV